MAVKELYVSKFSHLLMNVCSSQITINYLHFSCELYLSLVCKTLSHSPYLCIVKSLSSYTWVISSSLYTVELVAICKNFSGRSHQTIRRTRQGEKTLLLWPTFYESLLPEQSNRQHECDHVRWTHVDDTLYWRRRPFADNWPWEEDPAVGIESVELQQVFRRHIQRGEIACSGK